MLKPFKYLVTVLIILTFSVSSFAQNEVEYKDVILDGKPAKLNIATGEITLVKTEVKSDGAALKGDENLKAKINLDVSDFHTVEEGESLLDVSRKYKVSLSKLKEVNNLETTLLNKGQKLRVKNFDAEPIPASKAQDEKDTLEKESEKRISNFHTVKKDETLYSLAQHYKLSLDELKGINNLDSNLIKVGQKLRVTAIATTNELDNTLVWVVSKGDTLYSIAKKSGITVEAIKRLNGLTNNLIKVGQKLQLK
jgi:LysM repeat protein